MQFPLALPLARRATVDGLLAAALLALAVLWRGPAENRSAVSGITAIAHRSWPQQALFRNDVSARFTGTLAVDAGLPLRRGCARAAPRRRRPAGRAEAAFARIREAPVTRGMTLVCAGFGAGLALGGLRALRRS